MAAGLQFTAEPRNRLAPLGDPAGYNAAVDFVDRNIEEGRSDKTAFVDPSRSISYGELYDAVVRVGPMLRRFGIERENRVAMVMLDTVDFPAVFWGAIRAGVIPVLLNTRLTVDQYQYLLKDSRAKAVFVSPALLPQIESAVKGAPNIRKIVVAGGGPQSYPRLDKLLQDEDPGEPAETSADEVAFWQYSSGTTGLPKGVMHVHSTPRFAAWHVGEQRLGICEDDVSFSSAKMFFSYGLGNSIICPMGVGATTVLYPERPTPQTVFEMLHAYQPTVFYAVPTLYASILADRRCTPDQGSGRLRLCMSAGEPLPSHIGAAWKERFGTDIVNGVGSTELAHMFLTSIQGAVEYGTSGVPVEGVTLRLVDDNDRDVPDGEMGELLVRSPTAAAGYWNQRAKTRRTFQGEWTRTGDKYVRRADGVYVYCGRTDDMFKTSGIWVSPFEVEDALLSHPLVGEAAVIPAEDVAGLVKPKAFVVLKDSGAGQPGRALYEELKVHVKVSIGPWKYPRWIEFVESLPRTATGKVQRYKLRELQNSGLLDDDDDGSPEGRDAASGIRK
ncbi:MAG: benzoate-CoA ligase family protein [Gammaproteobacteria bacterium]|nr:benzoate-CoA ligase family protein [Gammaproteobacteria bacterium]MDH4254261.1 benzoate-CoA ligase family protein [Gammaproteobacteria bacterium]MDH5311015.1 benzoate-CoA ligase family protein [Gammaproteobacteria bacterium]